MRGLNAQRTPPNLSPRAGRGRIALAIRVRGSLRKRARNHFKHTRHIAENVIVPEPQHTVIAIREPFVANRVAGVIGMLSPIDFDDEATFSANEINNIGAYRLLTDEFMAVQPPRS